MHKAGYPIDFSNHRTEELKKLSVQVKSICSRTAGPVMISTGTLHGCMKKISVAIFKLKCTVGGQSVSQLKSN